MLKSHVYFPPECKYNKKDWTDCDEQTSLQTRLYVLKKGDPDKCQAKKVITKPCDKYQRRLENKNSTSGYGSFHEVGTHFVTVSLVTSATLNIFFLACGF